MDTFFSWVAGLSTGSECTSVCFWFSMVLFLCGTQIDLVFNDSFWAPFLIENEVLACIDRAFANRTGANYTSKVTKPSIECALT